MCGPEDPLFTPVLPLAIVPFQAKESVHKTPLLRKFGNFSLYSHNFAQILARGPQIWKFSAHKPQMKLSAHKPPNLEIFSSQAPLFRGKYPFASPTLQKSGPHTPTWKKLSAPRALNLYVNHSKKIDLNLLHFYNCCEFWAEYDLQMYWQMQCIVLVPCVITELYFTKYIKDCIEYIWQILRRRRNVYWKKKKKCNNIPNIIIIIIIITSFIHGKTCSILTDIVLPHVRVG